MNHEYAVMFFFMATDLCWNRLWITGSFTAYFGLFISIRDALNYDEVSRQAHIEKSNQFSGKCHPIYYLSKYHKGMDLHFMHAFDWVTDRSINALSGLLIKCVVIRYRCYWLKAVASSIIFFLQFFNQIMPLSVYQIVFYWLCWRVPLTWIFCYQFHCQKFIATSLLPCSLRIVFLAIDHLKFVITDTIDFTGWWIKIYQQRYRFRNYISY